MELTWRSAPRAWLPAVPVLTGAAATAGVLASDLGLLLAAVATGALLWRRGRRTGPGVRGWTLLSLAVVLGVGSSAAAGLLRPVTGTPLRDLVWALVPLPASLLAIAGVLSLLTREQLRRGGVRLLTETALFFCAALVLGQVLVVGPTVSGASAGGRAVIELSCVTTAVLLCSGLVFVSASAGPRCTTGVLVLLAAGTQAAAHGLAAVGGTGG